MPLIYTYIKQPNIPEANTGTAGPKIEKYMYECEKSPNSFHTEKPIITWVTAL